MKCMIRTYRSGRVIEKSKFFVGDNVKPRSKRKHVSSVTKKNQNDRDAIKRLARTFNCNFGYGDYWLTVKYSPAHMERLLSAVEDRNDLNAIFRAAVKERGLFLRRVARELKKAGIEFKYIAATSDVDGKTGEAVRVHHHIIVNAEAIEAVRKHWPAEELRIDPLRDQDDYTPLATYILKQCRRQPEAKRFSPSRNLKKPIITEEIVSLNTELAVPRGAVIVHRDEFDIERAGTQYIRYIDTKAKKKGRSAKGAGTHVKLER